MLDYTKLCPDESAITKEVIRLKEQNRTLKIHCRNLKKSLAQVIEENEQLRFTRVHIIQQEN